MKRVLDTTDWTPTRRAADVSGDVSSAPRYNGIECESPTRSLCDGWAKTAFPSPTKASHGVKASSEACHGLFANLLNQGMSPMKSNVIQFTPRNAAKAGVSAIADTVDNVVSLADFKMRTTLRRVPTGVFFVSHPAYGPEDYTAA